jgi:hypothetical protein
LVACKLVACHLLWHQTRSGPWSSRHLAHWKLANTDCIEIRMDTAWCEATLAYEVVVEIIFSSSFLAFLLAKSIFQAHSNWFELWLEASGLWKSGRWSTTTNRSHSWWRVARRSSSAKSSCWRLVFIGVAILLFHQLSSVLRNRLECHWSTSRRLWRLTWVLIQIRINLISYLNRLLANRLLS